MSTTSLRRFAVVCAFGLTTSGCAALGTLDTLGEVLGGVIGGPEGPARATVAAQVRQVEPQRQVIHVQTQEGQTGAVAYDQQTVVVYQQQRYAVTSLQPGDHVNLHVERDARGEYVARQIDLVQRGHQAGQTGGVVQLAGRVGHIDYNRGTFELQTQHAGTVTVSLPYNPAAATADRFRRLRTGDSVGIEGGFITSTRVELHRFL
jgi:hypothetical protein